MKPLMAETDVQTSNHVSLIVKAEPETNIAFNVARAELCRAVEHLTCVAKDCHIESGAYLPSIFGIGYNGILIVEPESTEASEVSETPERRLQVKRNDLVPVVKRHVGGGVERNDPRLIEERHVFLNAGGRAAE